MKIYPLLLLMTLYGCLAAGESSPVGERNAALQYWIACTHLPSSQHPVWLKTMLEKPDQLADPEAEQANSIALRYLHLGADCTAGSFGSIVGCEALGFNAIAPHIGSTRRLAQFAIARARWRFENGHSAEALADCRAVLALGADLSNGSLSIELLCAMAIHDMVLTTIARYLPVCQATERANLSTILGSPRVQLHRDFSRVESAGWRHATSRPEELARMAQDQAKRGLFGDAAKNKNEPSPDDMPRIPAELVAVAEAKDPQIEVWNREFTTWMAESVALVDLTAKDFAIQRAQYMSTPQNNPLVRFYVEAVLTNIEIQRAQKARTELLVAAARAFDQAGGVQTLAGFLTGEGAATVTEKAGVVTVQVVRPGNAKPIEIVIGTRSSPSGIFRPTRSGNAKPIEIVTGTPDF